MLFILQKQCMIYKIMREFHQIYLAQFPFSAYKMSARLIMWTHATLRCGCRDLDTTDGEILLTRTALFNPGSGCSKG